jgi:hypothetical protein
MIFILYIGTFGAAFCTLLKYDQSAQQSSLEQLTERSIYQSLALVHPRDRTVRAASSDNGPVGTYARRILSLRNKFHRSPDLKSALRQIFSNPDRPPLSHAIARAQDRLYERIVLLCPPGPSRAALIRYAVYRRQGVPLSELQSQLANDPDFRDLNTNPNQPFLHDQRFPRVLMAFEQDIIDAGAKAADAMGSNRLRRMYTDLALEQLDAQISLYQSQSSRGSMNVYQENQQYPPNGGNQQSGLLNRQSRIVIL